MTLKLIALMSVTLFCCLAAFGLLLSRSEDAIMEEVERTVSEAGKQTVAAFARKELRFVSGGDPASEFTVAVRGAGSKEAAGELAAGAWTAAPTAIDACDCPIHRTTSKPSKMVMIKLEGSATPPLGFPEPGELLERVRANHGGELPENAFYMTASTVLTEVGDHEIRARIPMFRFATDEPEGEDLEGLHEFEVEFERASALADEEVVLSLPTRDYATLFDKVRERMMFLFLGVFALGTVLSAGLARRFTRPIRQLDEGLRRVSDGDLETRVDVRGGDEVARLGVGFNDMTRRLRVGRERARELTRQEKLSALGRLAAGVAHDIRNPLHSINLSLQHMRETCAPDDDAKRTEFARSLDLIRNEIHRLDGLVGNFLRFAKSERRERRPVDLEDLSRETAQLVRKEAEQRGVRIEVDATPGTAPLEADVEALRSALLNLVLNALEALEDGGAVTIRTREEAGAAVIEVVDTGPGISPSEQERVFEFGYTTREGGHGLGLAMVHQIVVEEHGGRVTLQSEPGAGTTFRLELPRGRTAT